MTIERERLPLILRTRSDEDLHRLHREAVARHELWRAHGMLNAASRRFRGTADTQAAIGEIVGQVSALLGRLADEAIEDAGLAGKGSLARGYLAACDSLVRDDGPVTGW